MNLDTLKQQVAEGINARDGIDPSVTISNFEIPRDRQHGDLALPCFFLAKVLKQNPAAIAGTLAEYLNSSDTPDLGVTVKALGPYLNFAQAAGEKTSAVLAAVAEQGDRYGANASGSGKTVIVEFSSPNIAKPFGIGHLRTTVLGNVLSQLYHFNDWNVIKLNHLGDWGKQYGLLNVAFEKWGDEQALQADPIKHLYELYVRINREIEEGDQELDEAGREAFRRLENGEDAETAMWERFRSLSLGEFQKVYDRLGISFDSFNGEAFYNDKMPATIQRMRDAGILEESQGAQIVNLEDEGLGIAMVLKSNGSTTYLTRDIAAAEYRKETYDFDRMLYVVGQPQELHFKQLFAILKKMNYGWVDRCCHIPFGYIRGMSTRKGTIVFLEAVLNEARQRTHQAMQELFIQKVDEADMASVAEDIGLTAVYFSDMKNKRIKDIDFNWDRMLSLQGDTGPYLQNALARIFGIFRNAEPEALKGDIDPSLLEDAPALELLDAVSRFPEAINEANRLDEPSIITNYLLSLAKQLHSSYAHLRVKGSDLETARARLALFGAVKQVFLNGFRLLGFRVLEEM